MEELYDDLSRWGPSPLAWIGAMERPPFYAFRRRRAHHEVAAIFAAHGFTLTRRVLIRFLTAEPQQFDEDAGGSIIRQLGTALAGQTPFHGRAVA